MKSTIHVIATTFEGTRAALTMAVPLARGSSARLVVIVPRIVPYAVELESHVESTAFFVKRYRDLIVELGGDACVEVCMCRSLDAVVDHVRVAESTIVIGGPAGRWLTSPEERFANRLSREGSRVVFVPSGVSTMRWRVAASEAPAEGAGTMALWTSRGAR
jgi:hypothetical protein